MQVIPDMQTSALEIERVCDGADESILETAAISVAPLSGGPEQLIMFVVLKKEYSHQPEKLKILFSRAIQSNLNPLFKVRHTRHNISFSFLYIIWGPNLP